MAETHGNTPTKQEARLKRPPVVTILGHVDHGKTTLLDYIRKSQIAAGEKGGITQRIGAYQIEKPTKITFIDTPGHEAFSKMRSRGAKVADIAVLVVAADDSVMPQTEESVAYIKTAGIPLLVAINKIDLPDANPEKVKKNLLQIGVACAGYGGDIVAVNISAKTGKGVRELLELIKLLAEMQNLTADPDEPLQGVVIESSLDKRRGPLATVLVKKGTLHIRDKIVAANIGGKVKALFDDLNRPVQYALPSQPVVVLGFSGIVPVGALVTTLSSLQKRQSSIPLNHPAVIRHHPAKKVIRVVVKADSGGALESVLENLPREVVVLKSAVGNITESDIDFAATTQAAIIGFNVAVSPVIQRLAENEKVVLRVYNLIYKLIEEMAEVVDEFTKEPKEIVLGRAKVIAKFVINKQQIAGVRLEEGRIKIGDKLKVQHASSISKGRVVSIRKGKVEVKEAKQGEEYGIGIGGELDFSKGSVIIAYNIE